ncbi:MAG TPA: hypothetical protein VHK88_20465 [Aquihabitans sp.]|jgi:hypothetical protein|nr:hypothetical protein [Aquihabitans sp.]
MTKPQQPELRRSGYGATDDDSAKVNVDAEPGVGGAAGPVPEANRPGHRPAHDQDKPEGPPPGSSDPSAG